MVHVRTHPLVSCDVISGCIKVGQNQIIPDKKACRMKQRRVPRRGDSIADVCRTSWIKTRMLDFMNKDPDAGLHGYDPDAGLHG